MSLGLNKALIVFQFTASVVLIIGTITVYRQLSFMRNQELGMNIEQTLIVKGPSVKDQYISSHALSFTNETTRLPGVSMFAVTSSIPGDEAHWGRSFSRKDMPEVETGSAIVAIDENFLTFSVHRSRQEKLSRWNNDLERCHHHQRNRRKSIGIYINPPTLSIR